MKFTFNWLKEFVKVTAGPAELAKLLTMAGLEVESLVPQREAESNAEDWLVEIAAIVWASRESPAKSQL